jgi:putative ABC transport system ATP-binding protein
MSEIEFEGVSRRFGDRAVLHEASGRINRGEFVVVLGRSGCGKSTLLNLIGGLDRPDAGRIRVDAHAVETLSDRDLTLLRRRHIGMIFQSYNLVPTLTVAENVALPLELNGMADDGRVAGWLGRVGLAGFGDAMPEQLSGGEQQRVAIARALVHAPALILADEPTGNLDLANAEGIVALLDELCRSEGRTLVMVTHSQEVVGLADRLLTIRDAKLVVA